MTKRIPFKIPTREEQRKRQLRMALEDKAVFKALDDLAKDGYEGE